MPLANRFSVATNLFYATEIRYGFHLLGQLHDYLADIGSLKEANEMPRQVASAQYRSIARPCAS
jgi:hypothetical protein